MAATAWALYNKAKKKIGNGTIALDAGIYRLALHNSASNASVATLSLWTSVNNEISATGGYVRKSITNRIWTTGSSAAQYKFDGDDVIFTASGAALGGVNGIKYGVIATSTSAGGGHALCWSKLSTAAFSVSSGNTLTVQMNASGIFTLT